MEYTTTLVGTEPVVITIGNFDGIHRGHQYLMHELSLVAHELACKPVLVTFKPHTLKVVRPEINLQCLTTLDEKLALARHYGGIADNIVIHFTPQVAAMNAQDFMDTLCSNFAIKGLVVGVNFSLGHKRMGNVAFLQEYGQEHHISVRPIALEAIEQKQISSTSIRALINEGNVTEAANLLGHAVTISGIVVHGNQQGRLLGFPTANLLPDADKLIPANGVYAARIRLGDEGIESDSGPASHVYNGAVNIGIRPTFQGQERRVEAYLLDTQLDLYDQRITIDFIARLRGEQRFAGIEALKAQIAEDVQQTRQILQ